MGLAILRALGILWVWLVGAYNCGMNQLFTSAVSWLNPHLARPIRDLASVAGMLVPTIQYPSDPAEKAKAEQIVKKLMGCEAVTTPSILEDRYREQFAKDGTFRLETIVLPARMSPGAADALLANKNPDDWWGRIEFFGASAFEGNRPAEVLAHYSSMMQAYGLPSLEVSDDVPAGQVIVTNPTNGDTVTMDVF